MLYLLDQNQVLQLAGQAVAQHASRGRSSPDLLWCSPEPGRCWYRPELPANPDARRLPDVAMERTYGRAGAGVTAGGRRTMVGAGVSVLASPYSPPRLHAMALPPPQALLEIRRQENRHGWNVRGPDPCHGPSGEDLEDLEQRLVPT